MYGGHGGIVRGSAFPVLTSQERDQRGRYEAGPDPLVAMTIRLRRSARERIEAHAARLGQRPTVLARLLLEEAIEALGPLPGEGQP